MAEFIDNHGDAIEIENRLQDDGSVSIASTPFIENYFFSAEVIRDMRDHLNKLLGE